jgi:hypothetical protein
LVFSRGPCRRCLWLSAPGKPEPARLPGSGFE